VIERILAEVAHLVPEEPVELMKSPDERLPIEEDE
jgi:hypothetical protein